MRTPKCVEKRPVKSGDSSPAVLEPVLLGEAGGLAPTLTSEALSPSRLLGARLVGGRNFRHADCCRLALHSLALRGRRLLPEQAPVGRGLRLRRLPALLAAELALLLGGEAGALARFLLVLLPLVVPVRQSLASVPGSLLGASLLEPLRVVEGPQAVGQSGFAPGLPREIRVRSLCHGVTSPCARKRAFGLDHSTPKKRRRML